MASGGTIAGGAVCLLFGLFLIGLALSGNCQQFSSFFQSSQFDQCNQDVQLLETFGGILALLGIILIPVGAATGGPGGEVREIHLIPHPQSPQPFAPSPQPRSITPSTLPPKWGSTAVPQDSVDHAHLFCAWCGTERVASAPFCAGCGRPFEK